ncbi:MAG TPA: glycosyltransferase, partial [Pyrinomonadaceae bacterium]|nr:glycosyltransferase [Pyrinomonadaceae bacterium]
LATRVGGIPELVTDGVTGYLVGRSDAEAMSDRILTLLADPELRTRMGQAGRETVSAKFDLRKNVAQLITSYGISEVEATSPAQTSVMVRKNILSLLRNT